MWTLPRLEVHAVDFCTSRCRFCSHAAPGAPRRAYEAAEYVPWLDRLRDVGVTYQVLSVLGGEPFLHPNLAGLVAALDERKYAPVLECMTNLFWLRTAADIDRYAGVFPYLDQLVATCYAPYGGYEAQWPLLQGVPRRWPRCRLFSFTHRTVDTFVTMRTYDTPAPAADHGCGFHSCTQLWHDGRLTRCCHSRGLGRGTLSPAWEASEGLTLDLTRPFTEADVRAWAAPYPFDACRYCSLGRAPLEFEPWSSRP